MATPLYSSNVGRATLIVLLSKYWRHDATSVVALERFATMARVQDVIDFPRDIFMKHRSALIGGIAQLLSNDGRK